MTHTTYPYGLLLTTLDDDARDHCRRRRRHWHRRRRRRRPSCGGGGGDRDDTPPPSAVPFLTRTRVCTCVVHYRTPFLTLPPRSAYGVAAERSTPRLCPMATPAVTSARAGGGETSVCVCVCTRSYPFYCGGFFFFFFRSFLFPTPLPPPPPPRRRCDVHFFRARAHTAPARRRHVRRTHSARFPPVSLITRIIYFTTPRIVGGRRIHWLPALSSSATTTTTPFRRDGRGCVCVCGFNGVEGGK